MSQYLQARTGLLSPTVLRSIFNALIVSGLLEDSTPIIGKISGVTLNHDFTDP